MCKGQELTNLLRLCSKNSSLDRRVHVHNAVVRSGYGRNWTISTNLLHTYAKGGKDRTAFKVFDIMQDLEMCKRQELANLLRVCGENLSLDRGVQVHSAVLRRGYELDKTISTNLLHMYAKCGKVETASKVFDKVHNPDCMSWNILMHGYVRQGNANSCLLLLCRMGRSRAKPDEITFSTSLKACGILGVVENGMQIHGWCCKTGYDRVPSVANSAIDMYLRCFRVEEGARMFEKMPERNQISWNVMIEGYAINSMADESLRLFQQMQIQGDTPDVFTFASMLKACTSIGAIHQGKQIHNAVVRRGYGLDTTISTKLMHMYAKCQKVETACKLFDKLHKPDTVSWTVLMCGYLSEGSANRCLLLLCRMGRSRAKPNEFTFSTSLKACGMLGVVEIGTQIHGWCCKTGYEWFRAVATSAIDMYSRCFRIEEAARMFETMPERNWISWNAMIAGYAINSMGDESLRLFREMQIQGETPDESTFAITLKACASIGAIHPGKQIHASLIHGGFLSSEIIAGALIDFYVKCGHLTKAHKIFDQVVRKSVKCGYGKHGFDREDVRIFKKMLLDHITPDEVTYLAVLSACSHSGLIEEGQKYFSCLDKDHQIEPKVEHYACMVDLLGRAGRLKEARNLIQRMPCNPTLGIWQTLLSACKVYGDLEMGREVGEILLKMDDKSPVNYVTVSSIYTNAGHRKESKRMRKEEKATGLRKDAGQCWVEVNKDVHFFCNGDDRHPLSEKIHEILKETERRMKEEIGYAPEVRFVTHDVEEESKEESLRVHGERLAIGLALVCGGIEKGGKPIRVFKNLRVCWDCHEFIKGLSRILDKVFLVRDANKFHKFEAGVCSCGGNW